MNALAPARIARAARSASWCIVSTITLLAMLLGFEAGQHVETAQARHREVGDDHVRPQPARRLQELLAVAHRRDHVEVVLSEQADEAFLDDRVVVGDEHCDLTHRHI